MKAQDTARTVLEKRTACTEEKEKTRVVKEKEFGLHASIISRFWGSSNPASAILTLA